MSVVVKAELLAAFHYIDFINWLVANEPLKFFSYVVVRIKRASGSTRVCSRDKACRIDLVYMGLECSRSEKGNRSLLERRRLSNLTRRC